MFKISNFDCIFNIFMFSHGTRHKGNFTFNVKICRLQKKKKKSIYVATLKNTRDHIKYDGQETELTLTDQT